MDAAFCMRYRNAHGFADRRFTAQRTGSNPIPPLKLRDHGFGFLLAQPLGIALRHQSISTVNPRGLPAAVLAAKHDLNELLLHIAPTQHTQHPLRHAKTSHHHPWSSPDSGLIAAQAQKSLGLACHLY